MLVLVLEIWNFNVSKVHAQDALSRPGLSAMVDDASGGAILAAAPGSPSGITLANGATVTVDGPADANGWVPVTSASGRGWIRGQQLAAVADSYMPSAGNAANYLPVQGSGSQLATLNFAQSGDIASITLIPGPGGWTGFTSAMPGGNTSLLGIPSGTGNALIAAPGSSFGPPATGAGTGAPAPQAPATNAAGAWQRCIIATAESGGGRGAGGTLTPGSTFVALPSRAALGHSVQLALCDAQGVSYGGGLSAPVKDVGPWRVNDAYWAAGHRPAAESMRNGRVAWRSGVGYVSSAKGRRCNGAGIDISVGAWTRLKPGISSRQAANTTGMVNWSFGAGGRAD